MCVYRVSWERWWRSDLSIVCFLPFIYILILKVLYDMVFSSMLLNYTNWQSECCLIYALKVTIHFSCEWCLNRCSAGGETKLVATTVHLLPRQYRSASGVIYQGDVCTIMYSRNKEYWHTRVWWCVEVNTWVSLDNVAKWPGYKICFILNVFMFKGKSSPIHFVENLSVSSKDCKVPSPLLRLL